MNLTKSLYLLFFILLSQILMAQKSDAIQWITFEQLEDSLAVKPKKIFIHFYADWCAYCKKIEKVAFKNTEVVAKVALEYYAIKMNAESTDTITFGGDIFMNKEIGKKRNPTHDIPLLLASRENRMFTLPAGLILDEKFRIKARYYEYIDAKMLLEILK